MRLRAVAEFDDGSMPDVTDAATWSVSSTALATIDNRGALVTTTKSPGGIVVVTAALQGKTATVTITIPKPVDCVFTANAGDATVSSFVVGADGKLALAGTASAGATAAPRAVVVAASRSTLYSLNPGNDTISMFTIDDTCKLSAPTPTATPGLHPSLAALSRDGSYLIVADDDGAVATYQLDTAGALTKVLQASTAAGPRAVTMHPNGKHFYVTTASDGKVWPFLLRDDGTFSANGAALATVATPAATVVSPDGKQIYVTAGTAPGQVLRYDVESNGMLTAGAALAVTSVGPAAFGFEATGRVAYLPNYSTSTVTQLTAAINGSLTVATATVTAGMKPNAVGIDRTNSFAYVTNETDATVSQFAILANGMLAPLAGATAVPTGVSPRAIVTARVR